MNTRPGPKISGTRNIEYYFLKENFRYQIWKVFKPKLPDLNYSGNPNAYPKYRIFSYHGYIATIVYRIENHFLLSLSLP
jgi:hypothetical protein